MRKVILYFSVLIFTTTFTACEKNFTDEYVNLSNLKSSIHCSNTGFDQWGYNWKAHQFNGILFNAIIGDNLYNGEFFSDWDPYTGDDTAYLDKYPLAQYLPFWIYRQINVVMHWNETLISKEGEYPFPLEENWIDSDAWITFHYSGTDENSNRWSQFQKMVSARSTDYLDNDEGIWYNNENKDEEIGLYNSWDELIMIQVVNTGMVPAELGFFPPYKSLPGPGLGMYKSR